jgi:hypothetical protein
MRSPYFVCGILVGHSSALWYFTEGLARYAHGGLLVVGFLSYAAFLYKDSR